MKIRASLFHEWTGAVGERITRVHPSTLQPV